MLNIILQVLRIAMQYLAGVSMACLRKYRRARGDYFRMNMTARWSR